MKRTAAVIGAGFGGLALAIRLQSAGIATTVVEARDKPGGRAYFWEKEGHIFDAGPTVITDPDCLRELWALTGADMAERRRADAGHALLPAVLARRHDLRLFNDDAQLDAQIAAARSRRRRRLPPVPRLFGRRLTSRAMRSSAPSRSSTSSRCSGRRPQLARYQAWRSVYSIVSRLRPQREAARRRCRSTPCWSAAIR